MLKIFQVLQYQNSQHFSNLIFTILNFEYCIVDLISCTCLIYHIYYKHTVYIYSIYMCVYIYIQCMCVCVYTHIQRDTYIYFFFQFCRAPLMPTMKNLAKITCIVHLKQRDCQIFLQQRQAYSGTSENCSPGSAVMVSHMQVLVQQGRMWRNAFTERKRRL